MTTGKLGPEDVPGEFDGCQYAAVPFDEIAQEVVDIPQLLLSERT